MSGLNKASRCGECGEDCPAGQDFCCRECEDLWTYGPSMPTPGSSIIIPEIGHIQKKGGRRMLYDTPIRYRRAS